LKGTSVKPVRHVLKSLDRQPKTFQQCIEFGRLKFESYYCNNTMQLLRTYPLDLALKDGSPFWSSPKRPPQPIKFDHTDPLHVGFVKSTALLWARIFKVKVDADLLDEKTLTEACVRVEVPKFLFKEGKRIETDPNAPPPKEEVDPNEFNNLVQELYKRLSGGKRRLTLQTEQFEKDDDSNHHIDFIAASANLRARNYAIQEAERLKIKRIAGKIIPAIATTTSVVSGLVALELIKVTKKMEIEQHRNAFLNLALPVIGLAEPGAAPKIPITKNTWYTLWDKWELKEGDMTLQQFIDWFKKKWQLNVNGVFHEVAMVYMSVIPGHGSRLPKKMRDLVKHDPEHKYVDLIVTFADDNDVEVTAPTVRYFF